MMLIKRISVILVLSKHRQCILRVTVLVLLLLAVSVPVLPLFSPSPSRFYPSCPRPCPRPGFTPSRNAFIEPCKSPDGKRCCRFVTSGRRLDFSAVIQSAGWSMAARRLVMFLYNLPQSRITLIFRLETNQRLIDQYLTWQPHVDYVGRVRKKLYAVNRGSSFSVSSFYSTSFELLCGHHQTLLILIAGLIWRDVTINLLYHYLHPMLVTYNWKVYFLIQHYRFLD